MKGNKCFFIGIILCLFVACTNRNQQFAKEMKALQSKEIKLPSKGLVLLQSTELHEVEMNEKALKLVIYTDSVGCTSCAINQINLWDSFIDYANQFNNQLRFYFIFSPVKKDLNSIKLAIANSMFEYPIVLDTLREFEKLNPHLPKNRSFHSFLLDKNNNATTTTVTVNNNANKLTDKDGNDLGTAATDPATADETAKALIKALSNTSLGDKFDFGVDVNKKLTLTTKDASDTPSSVLISVNGAAGAVADATTKGVEEFTTINKEIGAYDGTGNIEDKIFTVNGEKFAYVTDPSKLGDDYKDVNFVQTEKTDGTVGATDASAMAKLISAKTGINAEVDKNKNTTVNLKPSATATGKGIELQIGANEGQTMSFTLDDMSADALGVGGSSVNLSTQESAKTATTTIDAAIKKVSAARGKMGAVQNRLEHTINNLDTASENLQTAESRIRDTDMAEEMVNYSKNSILAQAGQSMLAQANQANQGVLTLLQ